MDELTLPRSVAPADPSGMAKPTGGRLAIDPDVLDRAPLSDSLRALARRGLLCRHAKGTLLATSSRHRWTISWGAIVREA